MAPVPLPGDFTLGFAPDLRRPSPAVLVGGAPLRILRLTGPGATLVGRWMAGEPVGAGRAAGTLAARLVEAGMASPQPPVAAGRQPVAAIVIPVRDDPAGLEATLRALADTAPGVPVMVVDDGSDPPVRLTASGEKVSLHRAVRSGGPAAARNTGGSRVDPTADVVVFVDAGCVPAPGWLDTVLAHFADPGTGAVAPRVRARPEAGTPPGLARYDAAHSPLDMGSAGGPVRPGAAVPYVPSAVLAVKVTALRESGGFDPALRFGEDVDLVWRIGAAGWRVRYEPAATVTHPTRPTRWRWARQRFDYGRSATPLAARHGRAVAPLAVSPWSLASWGAAAAGRPLTAIALIAGSSEALRRRAAGDAALGRELRRMAWSGNLRAGGAIASVLRRAWLPPVLLAAGAARRAGGRRTRISLAATTVAVAVGPGLADWRRRAGGRTVGGAAAWAAWCLADDLAYQAGVWAGAIGGRSAGALLPRWWTAR